MTHNSDSSLSDFIRPSGGFPSDFNWGAATAAFQIEGASREDGKGLSVWDMVCAKPGAIYRNATADMACDHYHRYREDIAIMEEIGLTAYRFSVSWPRILPDGTGRVNEKGLSFYDRLVDALLEAGIEPYLTLFHWDYPLSLFQRGGWLNADCPMWFAEYAQVVARRLGDRVRFWITLNEPQCFIGAGHLGESHAPGSRLEISQALRAVHHSLLAHGRAVEVLRTACSQPVRIGICLTSAIRTPATESAADIATAREAYFQVERDLSCVSLWGDPVYLGKYPAQACEVFKGKMPDVTSDDLRVISAPLDFLGCNTYTAMKVTKDKDGKLIYLDKPAGNPVATLGWLDIEEDALYWAARFQSERYGGLPFLVAENGFAGTDWAARDGKVHDPQRSDFIARYLTGLQRAAREKIRLAGYFYWSLLDNFEWTEGYRPRFGLVHVDYETQERTIKDSAYYYREIIATNGRILAGIPAAGPNAVNCGCSRIAASKAD
jgi:beta-glucosidase